MTHQPCSINQYDVHEICAQPKRPPWTENWLLLRDGHQERKGFRCRVSVSTHKYLCGVWGHLKPADVPEIQHEIYVAPDWCRNMVQTRIFRPPDSNDAYPVIVGKTNIFPIQARGALLIQDGKLTCQGQEMKIQGNLLKDVYESREYKVLITEETFLVRMKNSQVEVLSEHTSLLVKTGTLLWDGGRHIYLGQPSLSLPVGKCEDPPGH